MSTDFSSTVQMRDSLRRGELTARSLVQTALDRIDAAHELGAFVSVQAEHALAEADAADRLIAATPVAARGSLPPLLGVPTAHKDLVDVRGAITTHGSRAVPHTVADNDSPIAAVVRRAGAISLGKTQVPEFGIAGYSENAVAPPARHPLDPSLTSGGSSGGSATAVAARLIPAAIGSDAGGSIRIPSAACGLVGLKPGRGVVPADVLADRGAPTSLDGPRLAVSGPMAHSASDAALLFDAICERPDEPALAAVTRAEQLRGLRIGVSLSSPFESRYPITYSPEARAAVSAATSRLEAAGHHVEHAAIHYDVRYPDAFTTVWTHSLTRIGFGPGDEERLGELARMFLDRARTVTPEILGEAITALHAFASNAVLQWGAYDAILTPALAFTPPEVGAFRALGPDGDYQLQCEWAPQTSMVNVTGMPAVTAPTLVTAEGLPMGVQLIGRSGTELQLLQLAEQLMWDLELRREFGN